MKPFSLKSRTFGRGQTNWADQFWGIWGIFGQIPPLFLQKTKPIFILIWNWNWDLNLNLNLGCKELGISLRVSLVHALKIFLV
jgi:hypothetical protein